MPLLIWVGVPANVANGTNRIAVLLQDFVGMTRFARKGALDVSGTAWLAGPTVVGALIGARINAVNAGLEIVYDETYPPNTVDFSPVIRKIQSTHADVVSKFVTVNDATVVTNRYDLMPSIMN